VPTPSYSQPAKIQARQLSLTHAVSVLTTRRAEAAVVPRDYVRRVRTFLMSQTETLDHLGAVMLDDDTLATWESFWDTHNSPKAAGDLKVAYLAGPEPLNDFRVLVSLGVHPFNIWAFESDTQMYNEALTAIRASEFPLLKLQKCSLDLFLRTAPTVFDIIYLDACGRFPSTSQKTLRSVVDIFRYQRLATPGVLITNFSAPAENETDAYADLVSLSLYPRPMLESKLDASEDPLTAWNLTEGPVAHSFEPKNQDDAEASFFHAVRGDMPFYYGQYITRQIFDIASLIAPWTSFANSEAWTQYVSETPKKIADAAPDFKEPQDDEDVSTLISDPDHFPIGWTLAASQNGEKWTDINYPVREPGSASLIQAWKAQLSGHPVPRFTAEVALIAYGALRDGQGPLSAGFEAVMRSFDFMRNMHFFCDIPNSEIAMLPVVAQFARPMHYNVVETRRFAYTAKETQMFLDVIPFDACRYLYDWLPPLDLVPTALELERFQLAFRFALDGVAKHKIRYNTDYFFGVHAVGVNHNGFGEKLLIPRITLEPGSSDDT